MLPTLMAAVRAYVDSDAFGSFEIVFLTNLSDTQFACFPRPWEDHEAALERVESNELKVAALSLPALRSSAEFPLPRSFFSLFAGGSSIHLPLFLQQLTGRSEASTLGYSCA